MRDDSSAPTELTPSTQVLISSTSALTQQHTSCVHPGPSSAPTELAPSTQVPTASTSASAQQRGSGARSGPTKLLSIPETSLFGRNKYKWSATPMISKFSRTPRKNLLTGGNPGPKGDALDAEMEIECFSLFLNNDILTKIMTHTDECITRLCVNFAKQKPAINLLQFDELKALIGVLIFSGCQHDNHLRSDEMFHTKFGHPMYRSALSERRFAFLIRCLHFDDASTQAQRKINDRFIHIRTIWDTFISNCTNNYNPSSAITVDEQLLAFRGKCLFRMYIPNKPAKYGLKLVMACDVESKYMLNAIPYLGKSVNTASIVKEIGMGHYYAKELTKPYHHTGRNITYDN